VGGGCAGRRFEPPVGERLKEIRCRTLLVVGDDDVPDMRASAVHLAATIEAARLAPIRNAAHLPSLERAAEVNPILLEFLAA
jgi:pimeloyl-ACP methyl ester carboxylesterase